MNNEWLRLLEIFIWHILKGTFSAFINTSCRKWTANVEATKLVIYFHWKPWNIYNMSHLGFRDWVNNLLTYCLCRDEIDFFILVIRLYPFRGLYCGRSMITLQFNVFYQVYKMSNITECLRVIWKLIVW